MEIKNVLKTIREKRNDYYGKEDKVIMKKVQKRAVEIIEYEDGSYLLKGFAYNLPLQDDEIKDAFESWLDGSLEKKGVEYEN